MFKKTMTFDNLDGEEVTQTFYFNYNKKEIAELIEFGCIQKYADPNRTYIPLERQLEILSTPTEESGLDEADNNRQAYAIFQDLILDAFGVKEADNVTFTKNATLRAGWENHVAFVEMIFEFLESPQLAATFVESCLPSKMVAAAKVELQKEAQQKGGARLSSDTITEMVEEAARRQKDLATRIEPGLEAAKEALGLDGTEPVLKLAESLADSSEKIPQDLMTEEDLLTMPQEEFEKLDIKTLSKELLMVAFKRKTSG